MSVHVGMVETEVELLSEQGPGIAAPPGSTALDERSRLLQQLVRERAIALRTRAEGFSDD